MLVPYKRISILTNKTIQEATSILQRNTTKRAYFKMFKDTSAFFEGDVSPVGFSLNRLIHYNNSFIPQIDGRFVKNDKGLQIQVNMHLHTFTMIFCMIWIILVFIFFLAFIQSMISSIRYFKLNELSNFIPFFLLLFGYLIFTVPFKIEAKIAENKFYELFCDDSK
jgi:hypothetical protein